MEQSVKDQVLVSVRSSLHFYTEEFEKVSNEIPLTTQDEQSQKSRLESLSRKVANCRQAIKTIEDL